MARHEAVLIRVSTDEQDHQGQIGNVERMLAARNTTVPRQYWFIYTVSRSKVAASKEFQRFMAQVEADEISTAYVESRDRFGQTDPGEYFSLMATLCRHDTRLIALRENTDLTRRDMAEDVTAVIGAHNNDQKLRQTGYQSIRTRVSNFKATGSWPTGPHPFGYGKACYGPDGVLKWVWQPVSRTRGFTYDPDRKGKLRNTPREKAPAKIPRKDRVDVTKLVPSDNPDYLRTVRRVFKLYTELSLSRRAISARLNAEGLQYYDKPFTYSLITTVLENPAYMGDTHFGKTQAGDFCTFEADGQLKELKGRHGKPQTHQPGKRRGAAERVVMEGTHEPLIDRKTWQRAKDKLAAEREHTSYAPRNPNYYLKSLLVCGHCGKGMAGRTDGKVVAYLCGSYAAACSNGQEVECGFHRIRHDEAEQMLRDKIKEENLEFDQMVSTAARENLEERLARLGYDDEELQMKFAAYLEEGINALVDYLVRTYGDSNPALIQQFQDLQHVSRSKLDRWFASVDTSLGPSLLNFPAFKDAMLAMEKGIVAEANQRLAKLANDVERFTLAYMDVTGMQRDVLKRKADEAESELDIWRPRTVPLSQRIDALVAAEQKRKAEREALLKEMPTLEFRERGEAFRRLFKRVELYWDREWVPTRGEPNRKTDRKGRYNYTLRKDLATDGKLVSEKFTCLVRMVAYNPFHNPTGGQGWQRYRFTLIPKPKNVCESSPTLFPRKIDGGLLPSRQSNVVTAEVLILQR